MQETNHQDDLSLPDDLIEVVAQLSDDAEHLVASYPAGTLRGRPSSAAEGPPDNQPWQTNRHP